MSLDVVRADSLRRAAVLLAGDPGSRFVAGGTLAVRDANCGDASIKMLVLADGLGLDRIRVADGRADIGALATMAAVAVDPTLAFLRPVAELIGGPAVRNMATVGGNLFAPSPYGDLAVALLALGAVVAVEGAEGDAPLDLEDFFARREEMRQHVVRSVAFDIPAAGAFRFAKVVRRRPHGASVLSIAAVLPIADGKIAGARIAYGAMAPTPIRARAVEAAIDGRALDSPAIADAVAAASVDAAPQTDAFASDWYRKSVLPVHLARLLAG